MTVPSIQQVKPTPIVCHPVCLRPGFMDTVIDKIANGMQPLVLCEEFGIKYSDLLRYIHSDPQRDKDFTLAVKAGESWYVQRLSQELIDIGLVDIKDMFEADGSLRAIDDIPVELRRVIAGIEVAEIWEGVGRDRKVVGTLKKVKLNDKLKAIEMIGKKLKMFIDEVHVSGTVKVEHSVSDMDIEERVAMAVARKASRETLPPQTGAIGVGGEQDIQDAEVVTTGNDI